MKEHECINEDRLIALETEMDVKKQRLNHYKNAVNEIISDIEELREGQYNTELLLTKSIDSLKMEMVSIHTTIKNVTTIVSVLGGVIAIIVALPEVLHILGGV